LAGHLQLFPQIHGGAGALFAITERGVEDYDSVVFHVVWFLLLPPPMRFPFSKTKTPPPVRQWGLVNLFGLP
jgi:hypothetical protein